MGSSLDHRTTGRITLTTVARHAGVSIGTASMALAGSGQVLPATSERVRRAAKHLGYVPRRKREGDSRSRGEAGVIMIGVGIDYTRFPIYARLLQAAGEASSARGLNFLSETVQTHAEAVGAVRRQRFAGALLLWQDADEGRIDAGEVQKILPCVRILGSFVPRSPVDHVTCDNRRVGHLAAEYLWRRGHRVACTIQPNQASNHLFRERAQAFVEMFEHLGGTASQYVVRGNVEAQGVARLLASAQPHPTGIFAGTDFILSQFDLLLRHLGLDPGREVELVGCNKEGRYLDDLDPMPASIDLRLQVVAEQALDLMLWRRHNVCKPRMQVLVEPALPEIEDLPPAGQPGSFHRNGDAGAPPRRRISQAILSM